MIYALNKCYFDKLTEYLYKNSKKQDVPHYQSKLPTAIGDHASKRMNIEPTTNICPTTEVKQNSTHAKSAESTEPFPPKGSMKKASNKNQITAPLEHIPKPKKANPATKPKTKRISLFNPPKPKRYTITTNIKWKTTESSTTRIVADKAESSGLELKQAPNKKKGSALKSSGAQKSKAAEHKRLHAEVRGMAQVVAELIDKYPHLCLQTHLLIKQHPKLSHLKLLQDLEVAHRQLSKGQLPLLSSRSKNQIHSTCAH